MTQRNKESKIKKQEQNRQSQLEITATRLVRGTVSIGSDVVVNCEFPIEPRPCESYDLQYKDMRFNAQYIGRKHDGYLLRIRKQL